MNLFLLYVKGANFMKIAIDAMGGDHAPMAVFEGVRLALAEFPTVEFVLYGEESLKEDSLFSHARVSFVSCSEVILGDEEPKKAFRKKDSSLLQAVTAVKNNEAQAVVSAGNTGAFMMTGTLINGRINGIDRPPLSPILPTKNGKGVLLLDAGSNMDAKPEHLVQYAIMGSIFSEKVLHKSKPTVGLLNVGTENKKGTKLTKEVYPLLEASPVHFVGNVEARDIMDGICDVVVADGFSGNILLKSIEGTASTLLSMMKDEFTSNTRSVLGALLLKPKFKALKKKMDYAEYGGAPLLGLNHPLIKAHGSSNGLAIKNAIRQAIDFGNSTVITSIEETIKKEGK